MNSGKTPENGDQMKLRALLKVPSPNNPEGLHVPWYKDFRNLKADGFLPNDTRVTVVDGGPFFTLCISPEGVVWFRTENLITR